MANICENTLRVFTDDEDNKNYIVKFMFNTFQCDLEEVDSNMLEGYFDSKWDFPEELMRELYEGLPNKDDIDMTCLSVEWGCFYCAFHTCDKDGWTIEQ